MTFVYRIYLRVSMVLFWISVILFSLSLFSQTFAEFCSRTICAISRNFMAVLTSFVEFSVAEILVVVGVPTLILYGVLIISLALMCKRDMVKANVKFLGATAMLISALYLLNIGISYHRYPLEFNLKLEKNPVEKEQLFESASAISDMLSEYPKRVSYDNNGASVMPYSFDELSNKLDEAYEKLSNEYDFIVNVSASSKRIALSRYMTYTHISGVYMPVTGEANVNINYPDYVVAFTAAHELAHQRGIAREDEANFVAYLVCIESSDAYIRYSGYLNLYEYVASALYRANPELYKAALGKLSLSARYEMIAYSEFFDKYRDSVASEISGAVNDVYLSSQGTAGTASYGMVVDLAVAYYAGDK